jgi:hypothetical protein
VCLAAQIAGVPYSRLALIFCIFWWYFSAEPGILQFDGTFDGIEFKVKFLF